MKSSHHALTIFNLTTAQCDTSWQILIFHRINLLCHDMSKTLPPEITAKNYNRKDDKFQDVNFCCCDSYLKQMYVRQSILSDLLKLCLKSCLFSGSPIQEYPTLKCSFKINEWSKPHYCHTRNACSAYLLCESHLHI